MIVRYVQDTFDKSKLFCNYIVLVNNLFKVKIADFERSYAKVSFELMTILYMVLICIFFSFLKCNSNSMPFNILDIIWNLIKSINFNIADISTMINNYVLTNHLKLIMILVSKAILRMFFLLILPLSII